VLSTTGKLGLCYRRPERKAGGKVLCVGSREKAWPALTVPRRRRPRRPCQA